MAFMNETCLLEDNCGDETGNKTIVRNLAERVFLLEMRSYYQLFFDVTENLMRLPFVFLLLLSFLSFKREDVIRIFVGSL